MSTTKTTIELNGKVYDAATGVVVKAGSILSKPSTGGKNVDGFIRQNGSSAPHKFHPPAKVAAQPVATTSASQGQTRSAHKPERAHTLMRHVLAKPAVHTSASESQAAKSVVTPNQHLVERHHRASQVPKSKSISRFSAVANAKPTVARLAVRPHPQAAAPAQEPQITTARANDTNFENALAHATSHKQAPLKKRPIHHRAARKLSVSPRAFTIFAASLVIVFAASLVAYQNAPAISMRLAAAKAGFSASLPSYTPAGFAVADPIVTSPGQVSVKFRSNSDDRAFQITQKPSAWTSESLLNNFVSTIKKPYQTYQDRGRTIYVYSDSSATWVNGGVWYQISGNANLNREQLLHIASAL